MNCTLCDTQLSNHSDKDYFLCEVCGGYVKDIKSYLTTDEEKAYYELHNNDVQDIRYREFTAPITKAILHKFQPHHVGLYFGCGTGPVITEVLKEKGYHVKLYDPFFYPDNNYKNFKYDYIFSCEVFEHFKQPGKEIEHLIGLLSAGGQLLVMTLLYSGQSDFNTWYYRRDPTHIFILTPSTIRYISNQFGMKICTLEDRFFILEKEN